MRSAVARPFRHSQDDEGGRAQGNLARALAHVRQYKGQGDAREGLVPEGHNESSPVRSAGLAFKKAIQSRKGRSTIAYPRVPHVRD